MKRIILSLLIGLCLFASPVFSNNFTETHLVQKKETAIYLTKTGSKYHTGTCRYLSKSKIASTKKDAIAGGYGACKVCKP